MDQTSKLLSGEISVSVHFQVSPVVVCLRFVWSKKAAQRIKESAIQEWIKCCLSGQHIVVSLIRTDFLPQNISLISPENMKCSAAHCIACCSYCIYWCRTHYSQIWCCSIIYVSSSCRHPNGKRWISPTCSVRWTSTCFDLAVGNLANQMKIQQCWNFILQ